MIEQKAIEIKLVMAKWDDLVERRAGLREVKRKLRDEGWDVLIAALQAGELDGSGLPDGLRDRIREFLKVELQVEIARIEGEMGALSVSS